MNGTRIALGLSLSLAIAACGTGRQYTPPPIVSLGPVETREAHVHADGGWQSIEISVEPGETYDVRAEGTWSMGPICGVADADGAGNNDAICGGGDLPVPGYPTATLIGRIGRAGPPFVVGRALTLKPTTSGIIYLSNNSESMLFDNTGSLTVKIKRKAPQGIAAATSGTPVRTAAPSSNAAPAVAAPDFPVKPLNLSFAKGPSRPDDIAIIIGNADYRRLGKDIPDVKPAYADAEGAKRYAVDALGVREGNVIFLKDATVAQVTRVFGSKDDHRGQLFDWVRPGKSRVFVYYAGHGAPGGGTGSPYLVPADADAARIELNGYPLATLYANLGKLPAESVTVVLEACFSGASQAGSVITQASPVFMRVQPPSVPARLTVVAAGAADQIASWEQDSSHGLFTKYFLLGQSGEADKAPYGNGDGRVALDELDRYLKDTLTYYARRYYGRDQTAQIVKG